jgi:hypothetical protein
VSRACDSPTRASAPPVASNRTQNALPISADKRRYGQEEADRDAGEAGQDEEDCFRDVIGDDATGGGEMQACIPEKRECDDCRDDPNERSPYFTAMRSVARRRVGALDAGLEE